MRRRSTTDKDQEKEDNNKIQISAQKELIRGNDTIGNLVGNISSRSWDLFLSENSCGTKCPSK